MPANRRFCSLALFLCCLWTLSTSSALAQDKKALPISVVGIWDRVKPTLEAVARETDQEIRYFDGKLSADEIGSLLSEPGLVLILNIDSTTAMSMSAKDRSSWPAGLRVLALDHRDGHAALEKRGLLDTDDQLRAYWRANGKVNLRRMLLYLQSKYMGREVEVKPVASLPERGFYLPGHDEVLETLADLQALDPWDETKPKAALLIQRSFWITGDVKVIEAERLALQKQGFNVAIVFSDSAGDLQTMVREIGPDIVVEDRHGSIWEGARGDFLGEIDAPYLRPISMLAYTIEEWLADPQGLAARDRNMFMSLQELHGTIEPVVVGGLKESVQGFKLHEPDSERIEHFAARAAKLAALRRKPVAERKMALIHYNKSLGKSDVMRGSPTGAFLDAPTSTVIFLKRMKEAGYKVDALPKDRDELMSWMMERGRNIGPWAQGELEALVDSGSAALVPKSKLDAWMAAKLSVANRAALEKYFGPSPGKLMVVERNGEPQVVIPKIDLGSVLLLPQPERGAKQDRALLHSKTVPPPYNYIAFYWWLEEEFGADLICHFGTHGSLELLPGKEAGLCSEDWSDICTGTMPVVNLWIMDNLGEASLSRRRSDAALADHMPPIAVQAGLNEDLRAMHEEIHKWRGLEEGVLKKEFRKQLTGHAQDQGLTAALKLELDEESLLTVAAIEAIDEHLHNLEESATPTSLHVLGRSPAEDEFCGYLVRCLHDAYLDAVASLRPEDSDYAEDAEKRALVRRRAEVILKRALWEDGVYPPSLKEFVERGEEIRGRLLRSDEEISGLLHGFGAGFIPPGPGPDPIRNSRSAPGGRNLYGLNPEEIPTRPSYAVAKMLIDELLRTKKPVKVGIDLNGMNTMRDFGVMEGQIFHLLGVEPIWDENELVVDVRLIPREELGRDRVDVFVALGGTYKENFPSRVRLIDKAIRLAASATEEKNTIRDHSQALEEQLLSLGYAEGLARELKFARIFGVKPGDVTGTNILDLVPRSGVWEKDEEISAVYTDTMSHVYTGDIQGKKFDGLYESAITGTDLLLRVWSSNMTSQLSNHHAYEYLGGLSMAVKSITGHEPEAYIADVRNPDGAKLRSFEEVLSTNLQNELLNEKWMKGMMEHDYSGAGMMAELVKNTFGWDVTRSSAVPEEIWGRIDEVYARDSRKLGLKDWFERVNPHARQEILATMIEAHRKSYWTASPETLARLTHELAESVAEHGPSAGLIMGGNMELEELVKTELAAPGDQALKEAYENSMNESRGEAKEGGKEQVFGPALSEVKEQPEETSAEGSPIMNWRLLGAVLVGLAILILGYRSKSGAIS